MTIWFISDVHLSDKRPRLLLRFISLLKTALDAPVTQIYFLGDIFEYWLGDDVRPDFWNALMSVCEQLHQHPIDLFFLSGNRDFLFDEKSAKMLHWTILPDIYTIETSNRRILLMHGDLLCTQDQLYQWYRAIAHHPIIKYIFLKLPVSRRLSIIQKLRNPKKGSYNLNKTMIDFDRALHFLQEQDASILIHGHVHHAATHAHSTKQRSHQQWIMPDWRDGEGSYLQFDGTQFSLNHV